MEKLRPHARCYAESADRASEIAGGAFDLDHFRAVIGEDLRAERADDDRGQVDDADAFERPPPLFEFGFRGKRERTRVVDRPQLGRLVVRVGSPQNVSRGSRTAAARARRHVAQRRGGVVRASSRQGAW